LLARAIRRYGAESFEVTPLEYVDSEDDLNAKEREWINRLSTQIPHGYNVFYGGEQPPSIRARKSVGRKRYLAERAELGQAKGPSSLTEPDVRRMFEMYNGGARVTDIAREYDVDTSTVSHILRGSTWSHLQLHLERPLSMRRTTQAQAEEVFRLNHSGLSGCEIVTHTGLSESVIGLILRGKVHSEVCSQFGGRKSRYVGSEVKRQILNLRGEGKSFPTIAKILGVSVGTAWRTCRKEPTSLP
jgi:hypothetical protein